MSADDRRALRLEPAGFFVLRTPLLPLDELERWSQPGDDRGRLRQRLRAIVSRPEVREALYVASPSLDASLSAWIEEPDSPRGRKIERALVRYVLRMTSRATPFGLFAGCSVGRIADETDLRLGPAAAYRRHARLDGGYLAAVADALAREPSLRRGLRYRPSDGAYRVGDTLRFVEARQEGGMRSFALAAAEWTAPLGAVLARAAEGARYDELVAAVRDVAPEVGPGEVVAFVDEVIAAQLLVAELRPPITGPDALGTVIDELRAAAPATVALQSLEQARARLEQLCAAPLGVAPSRYRDLAATLPPIATDASLSRPFQVDLFKPAPDARLGRDVIAEIEVAARLLVRIAPPPRRTDAMRFVEAFRERYGEQELPLATVLDEDIGIGFARSDVAASESSPLLRDLAFGGEAQDEAPPRTLSPHLLARFVDAVAAGAREIVLDADDVAALEHSGDDASTDVPDALAAMIELAGPSPEAVAKGEWRIWLRSLSGPSGANLLGRFCHGDDELARHVRAHLAHEEAARPDALFAEIVHAPDGRLGNVISRPLLRGWEIPLLSRSGAPRDRQITIDDLVVSVRDGRVRLRSRRLGREIVPRMTTAHRHASPRNLGIYRFLCALQTQDSRSLRFDWGGLSAAPRLPRVRYGRVVLSPAQWRVGRERLQTLSQRDGDATVRAVQELRHALALPRWITVDDGDSPLPIDLENILAVEAFAQLVHDRPFVVLGERFGHDGACAYGPEGRFAHELVVPLARVAPAVRGASGPRAPAAAGGVRRFPPGSEWLYLKLYAGRGAIDDLVCDALAPAVSDALASGAADGWFFVRYADPDWHVRARLHGDPKRLHDEVLGRLTAAGCAAMERGLAWRVQLDTYEREVERYGGDEGIALAEAIFGADSDAVVDLLRALRGDEAADARWQLALLGIDRLLDDLGLPLDDKLAVVRRARAAFAREHAVDAAFERRLGDKFRRQRLALEALLAGDSDQEEPIAAGVVSLRRRSQRVRPVAARLRSARSDGLITVPLEQLARNCVHLHANRLLRASARAQELVLYDFLARLYEGQRARRWPAAR